MRKCSRQREWLLQRPGRGSMGVTLFLFDGGDNCGPLPNSEFRMVGLSVG